MTEWMTVLDQVNAATTKSNFLFFRGHSEPSWQLMPTLGRLKNFGGFTTLQDLEEVLYFDFLTRSGSLLPNNNDCWNNVFSMQHHGLPTRLLDWTETFAVALHFALKYAKNECVIWILDPFVLNKFTINDERVCNPHELPKNYSSCFLDKTVNFDGDIVAISPLRHNPRVFHQTSGFTLHATLDQSLEGICPASLTKIIIPKKAFKEAKTFLKLSGINEFSLFPDLDGLARDIKSNYDFK
jgi:hypothetical protein